MVEVVDADGSAPWVDEEAAVRLQRQRAFPPHLLRGAASFLPPRASLDSPRGGAPPPLSAPFPCRFLQTHEVYAVRLQIPSRGRQLANDAAEGTLITAKPQKESALSSRWCGARLRNVVQEMLTSGVTRRRSTRSSGVNESAGLAVTEGPASFVPTARIV